MFPETKQEMWNMLGILAFGLFMMLCGFCSGRQSVKQSPPSITTHP